MPSWWDTATPEMIATRNKKISESGKRHNKEHPEIVTIRNSKNSDAHKRRSPEEEAEIYKKISKTLKDQAPSTKQKRSARMKEWWDSLPEEKKIKIIEAGRNSSSAIACPNKPERELLSRIQDLGFEFVGDDKFWVKYKNPDFVNIDKKVIVELFGRYWHKDREEDLKRIRAYKEAGYKVVVVWDDKLYKDPDREVTRIKSKIQE